MKKLMLVLFVAVLAAAPLTTVLGGSVDHNNNFSAGYVRTFNRAAVTGSADAAVYNPAGTTKLDDGLHISGSNQFVLKEYSHENSDTYKSIDPTLFLPGLFVVYKQDSWAVFSAFNIPGGGGRLEYEDGIADTSAFGLDTYDPSVTAEGVYYGITLGGAYAITEAISLSLGGRFIFAREKADISTDKTIPALALGAYGPPSDTSDVLDYEARAHGIAGILGLHLTPISGLDIGLRVETITKMRWEYEDVGGFAGAAFDIAEGDKYDRDLPWLLSAGVAYQFLPELRVETDVVLYLNKSADWDGAEDDYNNGIELGVTAEYQIIEPLLASLGFMWSFNAVDEDSFSGFDYLAPELDSIAICGGLAFEVIPNLVLEAGAARTIYFESDAKSAQDVDVTLNKSIWLIGIGASYKFF